MTHHEGEEEKDVYNILGFIAAELAVVPEVWNLPLTCGCAVR